ncbi:MAG: hypothetical protein J1D86_03235 [Alistipes sp.]|nr:hypothetical protein [Alistipes sp.]
MKITGRNIKQRLYGLSRLPQRLSRARHFRGHGVHSPFVYTIVRQVFMRPGFLTDDIYYTTIVYGALLEQRIPRKRALQLVNLCVHCGYREISYLRPCAADLMVVPQSVEPEAFGEYVTTARQCGATLAIMAPYMNRERECACREIIASHAGTSVDNRGYLLIFNNHLPKQHFTL